MTHIMRNLMTAILLSTMLTACGGSSSSGNDNNPGKGSEGEPVGGSPEEGGEQETPTEVPEFEVTYNQPMDASVDVSRDVTLIAKFSSVVDAESVSAESFILSDGKNTVPAEVNFDAVAQEIALIPAVKLHANTTYTATLNTNNKDTEGNAMSSDFSWQFTTVAREFTEATELEFGAIYRNYSPNVYTNNVGGALAIWRNDPSFSASKDITLKASIWDEENNQWGGAVDISTKASDGVGYLHASLEDNGDIVVGWGEINNSGKYDVFYRTYSAETKAWSGAISIEQTSSSTGLHGLHRDSAGNITFAFFKDENNMRGLYVKTYYYRSNKWSDETKLSEDGQSVSQVKSAMDEQGNITVVWRVSSNSVYEIWSAGYSSSEFAWAAPVRVTSKNINTYPMVIKHDDAGNAYLLTHVQINSQKRQSEFFYLDQETQSWSEGVVFGSGEDYTVINSLTVAAGGNATLAGYREYPDGAYITSFYVYDPEEQSWSEEIVMDDLISDRHSPIKSEVDSYGNVLLIASARKPREESYSTWYRVYSQQTNMLSDWELLISELPYATLPFMDMNDSGDAFMMWQYELPKEEENSYPLHIRYAQFK